MDRRSLLFVISLSIALFIATNIFDYIDRERNKEWYEQQQAKKEAHERQLLQDIEHRTASSSQLSLVDLYIEKGSNVRAARGILNDSVLTTISWDASPLATVYANGEAWNLLTPKSTKGTPALYGKKGQEKLPFTSLPPLGSFDLQVVPLNESEPQVFLAEYKDGQFSFPAAKIKNELPRSEALVLQKSGNKYIPVGSYQPGDLKFIPFSKTPSLASNLDIQTPTAPKASGGVEKFYVLETPYQQLVFSNKGGALAEINLPFRTEENQQSVVKEIRIDRVILEEHPRDSLFPANGYYTSGSNPKGSFVFHEIGSQGGYYPLIRRTVFRDPVPVKPQFYALNTLSEYPELAELDYEVTYFDAKKIVFEATQRQRHITKTYTIAEEGEIVPYCIELSIKIDGDSRGIWLASGVPEVELISGSSSPALKYMLTRKGQNDVDVISLPSEPFTNSSTSPNWVSNSNGFFGIIMDPLTPVDSGFRAAQVPGAVVPSRIIEVDENYSRYQAADFPGYETMLPLRTDGGTVKYRIYAGPYADSILRQVDQIYTNPQTGQSPDYVLSQTYHGYFAFISRPFAQFLLILMNIFHSFTGSWAVSIILLTVVLRIILYPLNAWSMKSMARMQQVAPEMEAIKNKYKKDPKRMQLEIATLYRDRGINPLSGCFPMLIQMPFLLGMFDLLKSTFELRGAVFIPGWIDNLAAPDVLFSWDKPLWLIGNEFHLLPILLGVMMYLQQKLMSPVSAATLTEEQKQQKVMMAYMMPTMLTVLFYNVPSGLNIYWICSMVLGIPQQLWTNRKMKEQGVKPQVLDDRKKRK